MSKSRPIVKPAPAPAPIERPGRNLQEDIARQARVLWQGYGQPKGRDLAIWLEAERQVLGADPLVRMAEDGAAVSAAEFAAGSAPVAPPAGAPLKK